MARAKPANLQPESQEDQTQQDGPVIEYFGEGAKDVEFTPDPKAALIRVYASGMVLTDY